MSSILEVIELDEATIAEFATQCCITLAEKNHERCENSAKYYGKMHGFYTASSKCGSGWIYLCEYHYLMMSSRAAGGEKCLGCGKIFGLPQEGMRI